MEKETNISKIFKTVGDDVSNTFEICQKEKDLIIDFSFEMFKKLAEKYPKYGHSWEICSVGELINKLYIEMKEYNQTPFTDYKKIQGELIDVANLCAMIWKRLEENRGW